MVAISELPSIRTSSFGPINSATMRSGVAPGLQQICSPANPDRWIQVSDYPPLSVFNCTSCGASGDGPLEYHKSNPGKWGSVFVWIYCLRCMAAFGTINGDVLRTYKASPKPNSPTARVQFEGLDRRVGNGALSSPIACPTRTPSDSGELIKLPHHRGSNTVVTPPTTPSGISSNIPSNQMQHTAHDPFMSVKFPASRGSGTLGFANLSTGLNTTAGVEIADDSGSEVGSPLTRVAKRKQNLKIIVQMMDCEVVTMGLSVTGSILQFTDLPELLRSHLQLTTTTRALELLVAPGGSWSPFGSKDSRALNPRVETIYGRIVSSKPASPHEVLVLASDSEDRQEEEEEEEEATVPAKRRRTSADTKAKGRATVAKKTRARKSD
ncbi:hypothetical protein BKA62DRAFT_679544 [Auriculariales sp. MPI-PUGE-AT-0066]|nr:hypothetical protein BKA62DRAFT_679544 [Auriculariales sp. MPI-PUGE-AT-0066]